MAFGHPDIIALLDKIKPPYNISSVAQELATGLLKDLTHKQEHVRKILLERDRVADSLKALRKVKKVFPSQANFVLVRIDDASRAYQFLVENGIVVRDRSKVTHCEDCLRITIGTDKENNRLLSALATYD